MSEIDWPEDAIGMFSKRHAPTLPPFFVRSKEWTDFSCGEHSGGYQGEQTSGSSYHVFDKFWQFTERPAPQWSGDGLPPVGTVCEVVQVSSQPNDYCRRFIGQNVKIVAHYVDVDGDEVAVFAASDYEFHALVAGCFRPIRTEAQIAAEEREKACEAMLEIAKSRRPDPDVYEAIAALYDAGYRKQEPKP